MRSAAHLLVPLLLSLFVITTAQAADDDLRLNTVGYAPTVAKRATVLNTPSGSFIVRSRADDSEAFSGTLTSIGGDGLADFTALEATGSFYLEVPGVGRSPDFVISADAYVEPYRTAMLGFYGWRSGVDVSFNYQGQSYVHAAGHTDDALLDFVGQPGVIKDATGGWYDAGDYGKYIVNSAITMGALLKAWEDFEPVIEPIALQIPETGGALPDYLAELRFQLDWMLKMQFDDGSVSHKLTPVDFADFVMPADDTSLRYLSPSGSAATAGLVATLAKASRVFRDHDASYSASLLTAAELSYDYLTNNPQNQRPDLSDFENAQYQTNDPDDRIWAAAEMWETTGSAVALADFETRIAAYDYEVPVNWDWGNQSNLGVFTYLESARPGRDSGVVSALESALQGTADTLVQNAASAYGRGIEEVYWGSNGTVARNCITLWVASRILSDERYVATCSHQIAHLLGRNEYNRSQVTGVGLNPPLFPHDRRSGSDGIDAPYPGYLVGGASDPGNWEDRQESYETNEIAINWQGALVYALAGFLPEDDGTGGVGGSGGAGGVGGDAGTGDTMGTGGKTSGGGNTSGGTSSAGGAPGTGGRTALGGGDTGGGVGDDAAEANTGNDDGCGCRAARQSSPADSWALLLAGLALGVARRRHQRPAADE
jgi:endoglucanase